MKYGLTEDVYNKIKQVIKNVSDIDRYKIMNEIDLLNIIYKVDLVFIDENTKKELLESINRDGVEF